MSHRRCSAAYRFVLLSLVALMASLGFAQSGYAAGLTFDGNTAGAGVKDWADATVGGTWVAGGTPGIDDNIVVPQDKNITVMDAGRNFGGAGEPGNSTWIGQADYLRVNSPFTLTHNTGGTFEMGGNTSVGGIGGVGTFQNNGTMIIRPRNNHALGMYFLDGVTFNTVGQVTLTDTQFDSGLSDNYTYSISNNHFEFDQVGANTGQFVFDASAGGRAVAFAMLENHTTQTLQFDGDVGETPFSIVAGTGGVLLGLPGRGTNGATANFTYNTANFNGDTVALGGAPMHTAFDRTVFDDLFGTATTAIPGSARVGVGGAFDTIDLVSANSGSTASPELHNFDGRIGIGDSSIASIGNMMPTTDGGTLTISAATDVDWYNGGFNARGGTISNNGKITAPLGLTMGQYNSAAVSSTLYLGSSLAGASFDNESGGIVRIEEGQMQIRDDVTFRNKSGATFELAGPAARLLLNDTGAGGFVHEAGATFTVDPGAGQYAAVLGDLSRKPFDNASGSTISPTSGTLRFSPGSWKVGGVTQSTITAALGNSQFTVGTGDGVEFMPASASIIDVDPGALNAGITAVINGGMVPLTDNGTVEFTAQNEVDWRLGHFSLRNGSMTNRGVINKITGSSGMQINSLNTQRNTFTNLGTFNLTPGSGESYIYQSTTFDNQGLVEIQGSGTSWRPVNGGTAALGGIVIHNQSDGIIRGETTLDSQTVYLRFLNAPSGGAGPHELRNEGTLESTRGIFRLYGTNAAWSDFQSATSTELTEGTYRVISTGTDRSMLDLDVIDSVTSGSDGSYTGSIVTIGADANLVLSSEEALGATAGAQFPQLGAISTIDGTMYVHGMVDYQLAAGTTTVSGTLGGDGTYRSGTIDFTGSALDPSALGGGAGTLNIEADVDLSPTTALQFFLTSETVGDPANDLVDIIGNLILDGILFVEGPALNKNGTYRLFNYTGSLTDLDLSLAPGVIGSIDTSILGQVNLVVQVPEPSTSMLLGLGLVGLVRCSRRRKNKK